MECIAIDEAGKRRERQVGAIDRVSEQHGVAWRRFDSPETIELDDEAVFIEERGAGNLTGIVKADRRIPSRSD